MFPSTHSGILWMNWWDLSWTGTGFENGDRWDATWMVPRTSPRCLCQTSAISRAAPSQKPLSAYSASRTWTASPPNITSDMPMTKICKNEMPIVGRHWWFYPNISKNIIWSYININIILYAFIYRMRYIRHARSCKYDNLLTMSLHRSHAKICNNVSHTNHCNILQHIATM